MPLTAKGRKILREMQREYGPVKDKSVFYAAINKGVIKGAERASRLPATPRRRSLST